MATNLLWFVMAGFLLGFATSTLWEWFYFRKERLKLTDRRIRELEAKVRDAEAETENTTLTETESVGPTPTVPSVTRSTTRTSAWGEAAYRSPGVFLESEELAAARDERRDENPAAGRDRPRTPAEGVSSLPRTVPTVNSIAPPASNLSATSTSAPNSSMPLASTSPDATLTTRVDPSRFEHAHVDELRPEQSRVEPQSPADALRAKRGTGQRSRQEVLAALRRNSEAVQRGQVPTSTQDRDEAEVVASPFAPRPSTLVSPTPPSASTPAPSPEPEPAPPPSYVTPTTPQAAMPSPPPVRQRWANDPTLTERTKEFPDDLSKIKGIGDVYKQRLYRAGFYTWKQIAETDVEVLRRAVSANQSANIGAWFDQAEALMEKYGRRNAVYSGPTPDDMTKILGIGPVGASVLYRAGICTYEQLASTAIADLDALFPIAVAGDQPDFAQWVVRATKLADEKHGDA